MLNVNILELVGVGLKPMQPSKEAASKFDKSKR
jgi:hypothetical protein